MLFWIWLLHTKPDLWWVSLCWIMVGKGPSALSPPPGQCPLLHTSSPVSSPVPEPLGFSSLPQGGSHFLWFHIVILLYLLHSFSRISYCLGTLRFYVYPCPVHLYIWWFTWSGFNSLWEHANMQARGNLVLLFPCLDWSCWVHVFWVTQRRVGAFPDSELVLTSPILRLCHNYQNTLSICNRNKSFETFSWCHSVSVASFLLPISLSHWPVGRM